LNEDGLVAHYMFSTVLPQIQSIRSKIMVKDSLSLGN
jgi:hypothetical protein